MAITSQGYREPTLYRVSINGTEDDGRSYIQSKDITLLNDQTQSLIFDVSKNLNVDNDDISFDVQTKREKMLETNANVESSCRLNLSDYFLLFVAAKSSFR